MRTFDAGPRASVLIESMRDIGYSLDTALADIIDNSITAGASSIRLLIGMQPPIIGILDDGEGMSEAELFAAMRPGSRSPLDVRDYSDLGRFGLGLKTASFSQCRKFTVITRRDGATAAAQWNLDHVADTDQWQICIPDEPLSLPWADLLTQRGTLILWEKLDRISSTQALGSDTQEFLRRVDDACEHLELVFHRFLSGESGVRRVNISVNDRPLQAFDPFNSTHPATLRGPVEMMRVGQESVTMQAFTLPHHQKVTPAQWERYAGRAGYLKNQGFYVYRSKRLIIHGTWFGLARQMELTKLVRVRVDISNRLDAEWKIDVKKASAQPPYSVKERLRRIIETMGAPSKRIFTSRGTKLVEEHRLPVWSRHQFREAIQYRINPSHPVVAEFSSRLPEELKGDFAKVVELLGASLPMDALFADLGGQPEKVNTGPASIDMLRHAVATTYGRLSDAGVPLSEIREILLVAEPFRSNWKQTEVILNNLASKDVP